MGKEIQIRSVAFFFTRGSSLVSHLISQSCAPVMKMFKKKQLKNIPSHAGLVFETSLGPKVFEAHLKTDWTGPAIRWLKPKLRSCRNITSRWTGTRPTRTMLSMCMTSTTRKLILS